MAELTITERREQGIPHDPRSVALFKSLSDIDFKHGGDFFGWKSGGDGDNGEHLMYEMDIHFERQDKRESTDATLWQEWWPRLESVLDGIISADDAGGSGMATHIELARGTLAAAREAAGKETGRA